MLFHPQQIKSCNMPVYLHTTLVYIYPKRFISSFYNLHVKPAMLYVHNSPHGLRPSQLPSLSPQASKLSHCSSFSDSKNVRR